MDNPFEEDESITTTNQLDSEFNVLVWKENRGRKINTYLSGWNIEKDELKQHLKDFKKSHGCNGSIKIEDDVKVLHLQGDKVDDIISFVISKGVKEENITLRGQ